MSVVVSTPSDENTILDENISNVASLDCPMSKLYLAKGLRRPVLQTTECQNTEEKIDCESNLFSVSLQVDLDRDPVSSRPRCP